MTDKEKVLNLIRELIELSYLDGKHSGKWECCEDKESVGDEYIGDMIPFALSHNIPFDYDLEKNFDKDTWEDYLKFGLGYAMEEHGHNLKELVEEKIISMISDELDKGE